MAKKLSKKQIIDKLRIDEEYYGEFGRQWLSNSNIQEPPAKNIQAVW